MQGKGHLINGQWLQSGSHSFSSTNPLDGTRIWTGLAAGRQEVELAEKAAKAAQAPWAALGFDQRAALVQRFAERVNECRPQLIQLICQETGKPRWEADTEVSAVVGKIKLSIQAFHERTADRSFPTPDAQAHLRYKPHGVVAVLGAFNFPAHLSNGHIIPALLAGNTVLYKPSEYAPAVAELILQCWQDSGLPAGVINGLQGEIQTGKDLLAADIGGVFFTGSYATGVKINQQFADRPEVILALEMGGNNPLVITEVQNSAAAIYQIIQSAFITAGQRCTCARRLMVPSGLWGDQLIQQLIQTTKAIRVGAYTDEPQPFMGPVISAKQAERHLQAQQRLIELGAEPLLAMRLLKTNSGLLSPGILDLSAVNNVPDEEIFAPLLQLYRYADFDEAIVLANQTRYGLAAGLITDDPDSYAYFFERIRAGLINWNRPTTGAASSLPFGGVGRSGNHRPSAYFAADYCAYPIASLEQTELSLPAQLLPGIEVSQ